MIVYNYDKQTKEYISSSEAFINPRHTSEKDKYMLPGYATFIVAPVAPIGHVYCFNEEKQSWELKVDNRGEYINVNTKQPEHIFEIGVPVPAHLTKKKPTSIFDKWNGTEWEFSLADYKRYISFEIKKKRSMEFFKDKDLFDIVYELKTDHLSFHELDEIKHKYDKILKKLDVCKTKEEVDEIFKEIR